jgi:hypothetical protein
MNLIRPTRTVSLLGMLALAFALDAQAVSVYLLDTSTQGVGNDAHLYAANYDGTTPAGAAWDTVPLVPFGNLAGVYQSPFNNTGLLASQSYFSVTGSETLSFGVAQSSFSLLWGSIDSYNTLSFDNGQSWTGTDIVRLLGLPGSAANYEQVALVTFSFDAGSKFSSVTFSSSQPAFEFALAPAPVGAVPLPAAGWMLIAGAGAIAAIARRRRA